MAERPLHPANGRDDLRTVLLALTIVLATVVIGALAGGGAVREEPVAAAPPSTAGLNVAAAGPADCAEWTNGCVVCQRTAQGAACSTPGIACTRGAISCLRR
jgi:hypothetical protein